MGYSRYAYSIKTIRVKEPDFPFHSRRLTCTSETLAFAQEFMKALRDLDHEELVAVYLDAQNKVLGIQRFIGTANQAVVYVRDVFRHALLINASACILVHNHPSESPHFSNSDIKLTQRIVDSSGNLDIKIHDHILIAGDRAVSMRDEGLVTF